MHSSLRSILSQIKGTDFVLFKKADVSAFCKREAETLSDEDLTAIFDDIFAFNAYLGRTESYGFIEKVPFWEYSVCLEWCESHMMVGTAFDLNLKNARRFLGSLRRFYDYLVGFGKLADSSQLNKAIKEVCGGKKLKLIQEIPHTGIESYTSIIRGKETVDLDQADYWLLIMLDTHFDGNWMTLLEAAFGASGERAQKVKSLQEKMEMVGMRGLGDIICGDVMKSDVEQATAWFYRDSEKI
ncbi:MAG: hypothetical protein ABIJ86_08865 [Spirochaetota bacterium]